MEDDEDDDGLGYILLEEPEGDTEVERIQSTAEQLDDIATELMGDPHLAALSLAHALGRSLAIRGSTEPLSFYIDYVNDLATKLTEVIRKNTN